ncbi:hypothetical protein [Paracoccus laeviglucosivorans]|uniref:Uncharacterized protein n=1 Tax=Paracoccus laeviglucosivorans TaxID=1197861 RepID=A0A521BBV0_9RHOB|nr:hypothetical protein [Paracoccus laeviglucosivorans]SMO44575.1 hypothetical protein SAMN06265221_102211 [Paracoccus laeviglucosivorans]
MTRRITAPIALLLVGLLLIFDHATTPPNPYKAPPIFALGSGVEAVGGFCGAMPK